MTDSSQTILGIDGPVPEPNNHSRLLLHSNPNFTDNDAETIEKLRDEGYLFKNDVREGHIQIKLKLNTTIAIVDLYLMELRVTHVPSVDSIYITFATMNIGISHYSIVSNASYTRMGDFISHSELQKFSEQRALDAVKKAFGDNI